jgi:hypothetical protein
MSAGCKTSSARGLACSCGSVADCGLVQVRGRFGERDLTYRLRRL